MPTVTPCLDTQSTNDVHALPLAPWRVRAIPAMVLTAALVLLGTAMRLDADPAGMGTHQQLGLPPCGFLARTRLPCATCGMTTAFTHAVHGRLLSSLLTQPAGMATAIITAIVAMVSLWALVVGASLGPVVRWLWRPIVVWLLAALMMGSWAYKVLTIYWGLQI